LGWESRREKSETHPRVRINTVVTGEPARWLKEWKRRGIINSYTGAVIQALRTFNQKVTEQDLKQVHLRSLRNVEEEY